VLSTHGPLPLAIVCGLVIGKPVGLVLACALAVRLNWATKPDEYSWRQLATAGAFAGIGFTMSLFIAAQALPAPSDFAAAKNRRVRGVECLHNCGSLHSVECPGRHAQHSAGVPEMTCVPEEPLKE